MPLRISTEAKNLKYELQRWHILILAPAPPEKCESVIWSYELYKILNAVQLGESNQQKIKLCNVQIT